MTKENKNEKDKEQTRPKIQDIITDLHKKNQLQPLIAKLPSKAQKLVKDIMKCKTKESGTHEETCPHCGHVEVTYNSCKNPACPNCGAVENRRWIIRQEYFAINKPHFHLVWTVPHELNSYSLGNPKVMNTILFQASASAYKTCFAKKFGEDVEPGFFSVLHTWSSNMDWHTHVHMVAASGGAVIKENYCKWVDPKNPEYLLPVKQLAAQFKKEYLNLLRKAIKENDLRLTPDMEIQLLQILDVIQMKSWNVEIRETIENGKNAIKYLARYTHRMCIGDSRIVKYENGIVTFKYKDYRDKGKLKEMKLPALEFVRRFLMHVTPKHFTKVRYYGFYRSQNKEERIDRIRRITGTLKPKIHWKDIPVMEIVLEIIKKDAVTCSSCGIQLYPLQE